MNEIVFRIAIMISSRCGGGAWPYLSVKGRDSSFFPLEDERRQIRLLAA